MNSIRQRILLSLLIAGFVPLAIVVFTTFTVIQKEMMKSEEEKVVDVCSQLAHHLAEIMDRVARDLETLKTQPFLADNDADPALQLSEMQRLVGVYEVFSDISLYNAEGLLINSTTEEHPIFKDYTSWFNKSLGGKTVISRPEKKLGGGDSLYLMVYLPVLSDDGSVRRVIKARLSFERVVRILNGVSVGKEGSIVLLDEFGRIIYSRDPSLYLEQYDSGTPMRHWEAQRIGKYTDPGGANFLYASELLSKAVTKVDSSWTLLALKPMSEVKAVTTHAQIALAFAAAATFTVALLLGYLLSSRISKPIESASWAASEVAAGNLDVRMDTKGPQEILEMAKSFNQMGAEIKEHREGLESLVQERTSSLVASQKDLERTTLHLKCAIDSTNNGFVVEDASGQVVLVNQLFLDLFELEHDEVTDRGIKAVIEEALARSAFSGETAQMWEAASNPKAIVDRELVFATPSRRYLEIHSAPIRNQVQKITGRVWTLRDITENRQLEESLRQSQKMEAIGQLAGGVAHDFNNLLTGILGNLSLIELNPNSKSYARNRDLLKCAVSASDRATELVKKLLGFSRRSHMDLKPCDSNAVLSDVRDLIVATIDPSIEIDVELEDTPWGIMADPNLLSQVIMNLTVNAKDALEGRKDGRISLRSRNQVVGGKDGKPQKGLRAGDYICLTVEDNGDGIPEEVQKRIFEPFFTTKAQGKGTGLGLATSFGIVKQLGGSLYFESAEGEGTCFDVFLPRSAVAEAQPVENKKKAPKKLTSGAGATLLLVDDEELVRSVGVSLLERLGYRVLVASSGQEALEVYEQNKSEIDLLILDQTMPGLSGIDTFKLLCEKFGYVPVLICSGYLVDLTEIKKECGSCPAGFIQKPYQIETMAENIQEILKDSHGKAA